MANSSSLLDNLADETVTGYTVQNLTSGQTVNLPANGTIGITFTVLGTNLLKITLNTNKENYISFQPIEVIPSGVRVRSGEANSIEPEDRLLTSTIPFKGYSETTATISHADYHIYYHFKNETGTESERILKKPIVIVDGFDPMDNRNYAEIYDSLLLYDNGSKKLGDELRLREYDVVILNFPILGTRREEPNKTNIDIPLVDGSRRDGGADYIERNAFLLVKLIQELNAELQSNGSDEELVVVGPSMGGQISRYALAYMEKKEFEGVPNMDHNTRLWVSFDSPHLGANIPLSIQKDLHFFGYTGGQQAAKEAYNGQLHSVAARQMLIEQLDKWGSVKATDGQNGTAGYHQQYYTALKNNGLLGSGGWPTKSRNVALVNGNGSGLTTHQPSDLFLSLEAYKRFIFDMRVAEIGNWFMPPVGSNSLYFKGKVTTTGFLNITFTTAQLNVTNVNQRGSMDIVQGGTFNTQLTIKDQFSEGLRKAKINRQHWNIMDGHCFIPTVSALGFKNPSFNWNSTINDRDLVQSGEIPFDNYYIPSYNQEHVSLTRESVAWFKSQLDGNYYNQRGEMTLSGPNRVCDQATYTIQNIPPAATIQWSSSNNLFLSGENGKASAAFRSYSDLILEDIYGWIQAEIQVGAGSPSVVVKKENLTVGIPRIKQLNVPSVANTGEVLLFTCELYHPSWNVSWSITPNNGFTMNNIGNNRIHVGFGKGGYYVVRASVSNSCGTDVQERTIQVIQTKPCDDCPPPVLPAMPLTVVTYPNPATDIVTVELREEQPEEGGFSMQRTDLLVNPGSYEIQLWNMGAMLRRYTTDQPSYQIPVSGLPAGMYFVRVVKDGKAYTKKQLIK